MPRRVASRFPIVVFPAPINPTRTRDFFPNAALIVLACSEISVPCTCCSCSLGGGEPALCGLDDVEIKRSGCHVSRWRCIKLFQGSFGYLMDFSVYRNLLPCVVGFHRFLSRSGFHGLARDGLLPFDALYMGLCPNLVKCSL